MSAPTTADKSSEQVKFLVVCIKHTEGGKPDFQKVADEMGIVSKAAAGKRYERLLKTYGLTSSGQPIGSKSPTKVNTTTGDDAEVAVPKTPKSTGKRAKKTADTGADGEESPTKKRKAAPKAKKEVDPEETEDEKERIKDDVEVEEV
ncbi:hypothetical protein LTS18_009832 [Coniosporium uncinatum]|uniref:Uncharacterized protein n=1 Tax=Coniosporium uncinatum TaxID=93489 RepID=A0ACC3DLR3_9PEZI|nr:hypothetical protein LTS18_009832 [Coniosporium uncinatum]